MNPKNGKISQAAEKLIDIKGRYLILDTEVMNVRKYTGYDFKNRYINSIGT